MYYLSTFITKYRLALGYCVLLVVTGTLSTYSLADTRWYQVEVVIAERHDTHIAAQSERLAQPDAYVKRGMRVLDDVREGTTDIQSYPAFTSLPDNYRGLNQQADKLNKSSLYTVLFHHAWLQPFTQHGAPTWIDIVSEDNIFDVPKVIGSIGIELKRFLHVHTHLVNHVKKNELFDSPIPSKNLVVPLENPAPINKPTGSFVNYQDLKQTNVIQNLWFDHEKLSLYVMNQSRKMRSRRLHYLDFPTLAVLVRFDPYDPETGTLIPTT